MRPMTATQMAQFYVANSEARRQKALKDSVYTPELKEAMANYVKTAAPALKVSEEWKKHLVETIAHQSKAPFSKIDIPQSLLEHVQRQFRQQNETIGKVIKLHGALPTTAFKLPEGWTESVAAWRERLEAEGALGDLAEVESPAERLQQLVEERQRIVTCIARCAAIFEACRYFGIDIPPVLCGLVLVAYVLGDVANDVLNERD